MLKSNGNCLVFTETRNIFSSWSIGGILSQRNAFLCKAENLSFGILPPHMVKLYVTVPVIIYLTILATAAAAAVVSIFYLYVAIWLT